MRSREETKNSFCPLFPQGKTKVNLMCRDMRRQHRKVHFHSKSGVRKNVGTLRLHRPRNFAQILHLLFPGVASSSSFVLFFHAQLWASVPFSLFGKYFSSSSSSSPEYISERSFQTSDTPKKVGERRNPIDNNDFAFSS